MHWTEARTARNQCLRHVRQAKADFIKYELETNRTDSMTFWPNKSTTNNFFTLYDESNSEISAEKTSSFINSFFATVGSNLAEKFSEDWVYHGDQQDLLLPEFEINFDLMIKFVKEIS